jgi:hypothetical protein
VDDVQLRVAVAGEALGDAHHLFGVLTEVDRRDDSSKVPHDGFAVSIPANWVME